MEARVGAAAGGPRPADAEALTLKGILGHNAGRGWKCPGRPVAAKGLSQFIAGSPRRMPRKSTLAITNFHSGATPSLIGPDLTSAVRDLKRAMAVVLHQNGAKEGHELPSCLARTVQVTFFYFSVSSFVHELSLMPSILQKKNEVFVDSLPYIDKEFDFSATKEIVERLVELSTYIIIEVRDASAVFRLIEEEMEGFEPDDYLSMLPPVPAPHFPEGSVLKSEFDRLSKAPSSHLPAIDMSRCYFVQNRFLHRPVGKHRKTQIPDCCTPRPRC